MQRPSRRRSWRSVLVGPLAAGVLLAGCSGDALPEVDVAAVDAPDVAVTVDADLVDGGWPAVAGFVRDRSAEGRPVLVNAFASWCAPCRDELPLLVEASGEHPDVVFLGVAHQDRREDAEAMVDEFALPYATVFDRTGETVFALEGTGMPVTALFDADGELVEHKVGELTAEELDGWLSGIEP